MLISVGILLEIPFKIDIKYLIFSVSLIAILIVALSFALMALMGKKAWYEEELLRYKKLFGVEMFRFAQSERMSVAKNLHDDISLPLNVVKLNLTKISRNNCDKALSEKLIAESMSLVDESIEQIRAVAKNYGPAPLMKLGYTNGISELCKQINNSEHITIELVIKADEKRLPHALELQVYRITQEILNNIVKHSYSTEINISINSNEKGVNTVISYSGFGLDSKTADELSETDKGTGLKNIQTRAETIGASVQYLLVGCNQYQTTINVPI